MDFRPFVVLLFLTYAHCETAFTEEKNVIVLNKENFNGLLKVKQLVLVEFYAPWCGHCQALKPEYEAAATKLKTIFPEGNVRLAKVDATVENELASEHGVKGYPTLKLHKNGKWYDYNGDRKSDEIVAWMERKTQPALKPLASSDELDSFVKTAEVVVVGFIKEAHKAAEILEGVADDLDKHPFGIVRSSELFTKYGITKDASVVLFKSFDEPRTEYEGEISSAGITEFINRESIPLVYEFSQDTAGNVFGSPIRMHFVAFAPKSGEFAKFKSAMTDVAKNFKGKAHFIIIDTDLEDHHRIVEFFGMSKDDAPTYRMINLAEDMVKYKPDSSEFTVPAITAFMEEVVSGKRKPFLISQDIPAASDDPVRVLVGQNYNEACRDESKAVFVELYAPWCGHCQQLAPIWTQLGEKYKGREDIVIAKMDATANEAENLKVHSFPTLKYYPKGSQEVVDYTGERTLEALAKFVDSEGKMAPEKPEEEEEEHKDEL